MKSSGQILLKLAIMYLIAWCISPPLSYGTIYRIMALGAIAYIVLKYVGENGLKIDINDFIFGLLIGYIIIVSLFLGDKIESRLSIIILFCIMFCSQSFTKNARIVKRSFFIVPSTFLLCIIWNVCSLRGIAEVPNIMRLLAKNSAISEGYARQGVGGFGYLYTVLLMLPIAIDCVFNRKIKKIYRLIALGFVYTTYILIFQAQYFFAIILSIFLLGIYLIAKIDNTVVKRISLIVLFSFFVYIYSNADKVLLYLMEIVDTRSIDLKLQSIYDILVMGEDIEASEFSVRFERYLESFSYALSHPFFGGFKYSVTGNHSHILDFFAQYGIFVGIVYLKVIFEPIRKMQLKKFSTGYTCTFIFLIMLMLNTLAFSFSIVVYILLPLYYYQAKES